MIARINAAATNVVTMTAAGVDEMMTTGTNPYITSVNVVKSCEIILGPSIEVARFASRSFRLSLPRKFSN